ncbi:MAG: prenyltransferase [Candidatus Woesearchaeota archaeon]
MNITTILKISRPRFWSYTAGTYILGVLFAWFFTDVSLSPLIVISFAYFLFFGNYLIYGVNDLFDYETDKHNPKKKTKEYLLQKKDAKFIVQSLWFSAVLSLAFVLIQPNLLSSILVVLFLFTSLGYSMPPLRFKVKPFVDSFSNVLYVIPGFIGYAQITGQFVPWYVLIASIAWVMAMHIYSAIPDITYDTNAGIRTTATVLGRQFSFLFCLFLWLVCAVLVFSLGFYSLFAFWLYPLIPFFHVLFPSVSEKKVYWYFPILTNIIGAGITIELLSHIFM